MFTIHSDYIQLGIYIVSNQYRNPKRTDNPFFRDKKSVLKYSLVVKYVHGHCIQKEKDGKKKKWEKWNTLSDQTKSHSQVIW